MKKYRAFQIMIFTCTATLTGCASRISEEIQPEFSPTYQSLGLGNQQQYQQGSIFQSGVEHSLFEDMKARRVGDILTVLLVEQTSGQNSSDNSVNQATSINVATPTFAGSSRPNMAIDVNSENTFTGGSGSSQSNRLSGSIAVTVTSVLPNGNLVIEGEKWVKINQGNEFIRLQGVIRPKDIDTYNTLFSTQVADAHISYGGKGTNARSSDPGWMTKILFSPLWPF